MRISTTSLVYALAALTAALCMAPPAAHAQTFGTISPLTIPSVGVAAPYPSTIGVAGGPTFIGSMTVTITGFSHTWPSDVSMLLVGPTGARTILWGRAGSSVDASNLTLVFRDFAPPLPGSTPGSGDYAPTQRTAGTFIAPAPVGPYGAALSAFDGTNANGTWSLYVQDFVASDGGSIAGWSITFLPAPPPIVEQTTAFTYQGKLESGGSPVNGPADMRFSLWTSATSTVATGQVGVTVERNSVPVTDGLFTTSLDFGPGITDNRDLFLQTQVRVPAGSGSFTTLTPRQPLSSAVNAQFARTAAFATNATNATNATTATGLNSAGRIFIGGTASPDDDSSPGLWLRSPAVTGTDRAFFGMRNNTRVGFFGPGSGAGWSSLLVNTTTGNTMLGADADARTRLEIAGSQLIRTGTAAAPNVLAFGPYSAAIGGEVESTDSVGIYRVNNAPNDTELRIHIGDDTTAAFDSLVIGANPSSVWTQRFVFRSDGNAFKPGGGAWAALSDPRAKHDITPLTGTLDRLLNLRGYTFAYNDDQISAGRALPGTQIGLMADEVARVFPDWVSVDQQGTRFVTERATTALMVEALRDLRSEKDRAIEALKVENNELRERLDRLEKLFDRQTP